MSLVESDSSAIRIDLHLEMALEARPAFICILAAWYKAASKMGLKRSLGVLALSSVGTGEADPAVLVVPAEATDQVLCPIVSDLKIKANMYTLEQIIKARIGIPVSHLEV